MNKSSEEEENLLKRPYKTGSYVRNSFERRRKRFSRLLVVLWLGSPLCMLCIFIYQYSNLPLAQKSALWLPRNESMASREIIKPLRDTLNLENKFAIYDSTMKYKVIPFAYVGSEWSSAANKSVCMAVHSSLSRLHSLVESLLSWRAAASVALFIPGPEVQVVRFFLEYLQLCFPEAVKHVSFHFVYPVEWPPTEASFLHANTYDCAEDTQVVVDDLYRAVGSLFIKERESKILYPQNFLRNMAARACPSDWVMTLDVNMLPQTSLSRRLEKFLKKRNTRRCGKCAFVLPTYEVKIPIVMTSAPRKVEFIPKTKEDLLRLIKEDSAWQFHEEETKHNQGASKLEIWEKLPPVPTDDIIEAYYANYSLFYEPAIIASHHAPPFEERFFGCGMSRTYEMFLAGYKFRVLDNAFLTHYAVVYNEDISIWRTEQFMKYYDKFQDWVLEMIVKYDSDPLQLLTKYSHWYDYRKFKVVKSQVKNRFQTQLSSGYRFKNNMSPKFGNRFQ